MSPHVTAETVDQDYLAGLVVWSLGVFARRRSRTWGARLARGIVLLTLAPDIGFLVAGAALLAGTHAARTLRAGLARLVVLHAAFAALSCLIALTALITLITLIALVSLVSLVSLVCHDASPV